MTLFDGAKTLLARGDAALTRLLSRGLPATAQIRRGVIWPLFLLPVFLVNQLLTPHPVWMILLLFIGGTYAAGYWWLRRVAKALTLTRQQRGAILVAGDIFEEEFTLDNPSRLPLLWAEIVDESTLPGYTASRVVSAGGTAETRWRTEAECRTRGVYRIGPATINGGDPFGLFCLTLACPATDSLLIYPRVLQLPALVMPRGTASGVDSRRQTLMGALPAASVRDYQRGDSLRYIHWPSTAHRGALAVKELELEPSGDVWIVLDLQATVHSGQGDTGTLEYAIIVAASAAAALLDGTDQRAVGLLAVSGGSEDGDDSAVVRIPPQPGQAQLWRIMAALAPVRPTNVSLARLLQRNAGTLGRRRSLLIITPQPATNPAHGDLAWVPELLQVQAAGLAAGALIVTQEQDEEAARATRALVAQLDVPAQVLPVTDKLPPLVTYRRKRTIYQSTPTGGVVVREIEEEVG